MQQQEFIESLDGYQNISNILRRYSYHEILETVAVLVNSEPELLEKYSLEYSDGRIGGTYGDVLRDLYKNIAQFDWLYCHLGDELSREVLTNLVRYRMFPDPSFLKDAYGMTDLEQTGKDIYAGNNDEEMIVGGVLSLLDAKKHIRNDSPRLVVEIRHLSSEIWEIPRVIDFIRSGYRFFLHTIIAESEKKIVLFAVLDEQRVQAVQEKGKRILAMPARGGWSDANLLKDCGVIPYLLYKNHACDVSLVGVKREDYTYSSLKYVPGLKMEFLPDDTLQSKIEYLQKEAGKVDGLIFHGAYEEYAPLANVYKQLNPQGKIYLALDANPSWMDRIQWTEPAFSGFLDQCDVITTSGRVMQKHLNMKWPWVIEYIPNGFYNFTGTDMLFSYEKKKNVILTVGRLGAADKNTQILLEAFAVIADQIPDWSLRLAGTVEEEWKNNYLRQFWERFPELRERISFLGHISDKDMLYQEYLDAKIFALSSECEGGTPNVIGEALYAGDAIAITKIDAYEDAIDNGNCGLAAEVWDVEGFAEILLRLCCQENLEKMCRRAHEYARENFDMEQIVGRLYIMMFGEA